ncbi:MAG: single-stranded-DNA-specific exonuclease RecJ [Candidatus Omnitrophota bacterium]
MSKIWNIKTLNPKLQIKLSDALGIHPIISQLLVNRSIDDIEEAANFLNPELKSLHDPFLFKGMDKAVERILQAAKNSERVLIFGDYDVDGVTSSYILNSTLSRLGLDLIHHIPHRMNDGYGLNHEIAEIAFQQKVNLLITIDCGITAYDEVESIRNKGIDVIIIDHHEPSDSRLPNALAIIDPKQKDCPYPFKELASAGLALKVSEALTKKTSEDLLGFAALGTVADVVPLKGENRIIVKHGLKLIHKTKNKGLKALLKSSKIDKGPLTPFHIGFILGPRINAAGRMGTAHTSLDLFLCDDEEQAEHLTGELESYNLERQKMQNDTITEAMAIVEGQINFKEQKVIVLNKEGWHKGILGIVASRLTDKYYRPAIVISTHEGIGTASCRSIEGFHIQNALQECQDILENYGGHEGAAGLTIRQEKIDPFREMINTIAHRVLEVKELTPSITIESEIPLTSVDEQLAGTLESLQPFGEGNPQPVFCSRRLTVKSYPQIMGRGTLKFWIEQDGKTISAVGFGMERFAGLIRPGEQIDLAYEIAIDDWNKAPQAQLRLKDIKISE